MERKKKTPLSSQRPKPRGKSTVKQALSSGERKKTGKRVVQPTAPVAKTKKGVKPKRQPLAPVRIAVLHAGIPAPRMAASLVEAPPPTAPTTQTASPVNAAVSHAPPSVPPRPKVRISEVITVKELSEKLQVKVAELIKKLMGMGTLATINQRIDPDVATLVAASLGFDVEVVPLYGEELMGAETPDDPQTLKPRPPVVTIMGHVDHGKTSLLDVLRKTRVAEQEAGGITQHIGAHRVESPKGSVVFLDTPGHEAFTAMRARGAQVTDLVVLVVAADDGVMPQTLEAIDHARAAGVPMLVAVNKIDLPSANPERVKQELAKHQLIPEQWGGKTIFVEVSAKKGLNLDKLLEMILLEAELLELKANPDRPAQGIVIEARLDPRRGPVATVLVQKGTLKVGDLLVAGITFGKVRALFDDRGHPLLQARPSQPAELLGLNETPQAGDKLVAVKDERTAREIAERRQMHSRQEALARRHMSLQDFHHELAEGKVKELKLILKADVQGSVEALRDSLERLSTPDIRLNVIHAGVGGIIKSDVSLAAASDAVLIGFTVRPDPAAETLAQREGVEIRTYRIIYEAVADVRAAMEGLLEPEQAERRLGRAQVKQVFRVSKVGNVAGCQVTEGKFQTSCKVRVIRDQRVVYEGAIGGLRRFKDDVREVEQGFECGIRVEGFQDVKPGDTLEAYIIEQRAKKLETP
ncbi:MAG: translation initiation factor IF-2 [Elusimicrobia bacterium]|nr:translation initiation factor IF-2 [Elusimicrobiota bacterium]